MFVNSIYFKFLDKSCIDDIDFILKKFCVPLCAAKIFSWYYYGAEAEKRSEAGVI